jgi:hypothetical protein
MQQGIRWMVKDKYDNTIYLTQERWEHIIESINHPEMQDYEQELQETIKKGARKQDPINPQKYRYTRAFDNLPMGNTHIIAVVLFKLQEAGLGEVEFHKFIVTAYQKEIG